MPPTKKPKKDKKTTTCRICLSAKGKKYVEMDIQSEWSHLMEYCIGISVNFTSGPQVLCERCSLKLKDYSEFKTLALKSDTLWSNVVTAKVEKHDASKIETIEIKDETDDHYIDYQDVDYLDVNYMNDDIKEEISLNKDVGVSVSNEDTFVKKEISSLKLKVSKKHSTSEVNKSNEEFKGMSQLEFIKKYFEIIKLKKGHIKIKYSCLKCGNEYAHRNVLAKHVQKCHESEVLIMRKPSEDTQKTPTVTPDSFNCGLCSFQNNEEDTVMKHINEEHCLKNDLGCRLCDYISRDIADLVTHRFKHVPDSKYRGKYRCPTCRNVRLNELSLEFHYRNVHLKTSGGWCYICNKTFTGYIYYRNHMRLHKEEKFVCDICGAKFLFRNLIEAHMKEHLNIRDFVCDTCGKSFKRNNALLGHIRACHTSYKPVPCDHCNKMFKNADSLRLHMKMVNKGNNYICDVCCKGYPTLSLLKKHMFWHTGERPYACETCGGKYKSKGNLKLHIRKHMGIFPYKCDVCEKQFMTSSQLKAHFSVHTGIRRVKCLVCERTFHEKRQMLAHCQSKHESFMAKQDCSSTPLDATQPLPAQAPHNATIGVLT